MNKSQASVSAWARAIAAGGIDWPKEIVAVLMMPLHIVHTGRLSSIAKAAMIGASS